MDNQQAVPHTPHVDIGYAVHLICKSFRIITPRIFALFYRPNWIWFEALHMTAPNTLVATYRTAVHSNPEKDPYVEALMLGYVMPPQLESE